MQKIYKYGTGQEVPEGAIFISTVVQEVITTHNHIESTVNRFVWHYFLVEVK